MDDSCEVVYVLGYTPKRNSKPLSDAKKAELRDKQLQKKYGITLDDYNVMMRTQDGRCKICNEAKPLVVDHCHSTGRVRGLLCSQCNTILGMAKDNVEILKSAIDYL